MHPLLSTGLNLLPDSIFRIYQNLPFLQKFKYYKNLINKLTRINKTNFYKPFFEENKNDSKRTWDRIRSIINVKEN